MKKYILSALVIFSVIAAISCTKSTPSTPVSNTKTATPTISATFTITTTSTITATVTVTLTATATPDVVIEAFVNGVNSTMDYWITLSINGTSYKYATITVNSDPLVYNGTSAYVAAASTVAYVAGINYVVTILTEYGTYTGTVFGAGGNVTVVSDIVNYTHNGNADFILVRDPLNAITFNSTSPSTVIDPGFAIPGSAFSTVGGDYVVSVYPMNELTDAFTGPTTPSFGRLFVETLVSFIVPKT